MKAGSRGYTVVEVMSAMTLFAIGAAGVISMQRVTIQGGDDARHFDVATNIAREWEARLQRDSLSWTQPDSQTFTSNAQTATRWLRPNTISDPPSAWSVPIAGPNGVGEPGYSSAFDLLGKDIDPADASHVFCVQYRLGWIANSNNGASPTAVIRAEIRVFWSRLEYGPANCGNLTVFETAATRVQHHFVFLTTAVRGNPLR